MGDGIYAALSGAIAHATALEVTATNLANSDTTGYRALRPVFQEVLAAQRRDNLRFTAIRKTAIEPEQGSLKQTDRPLDLALGPSTFLAVETPAGERYTRAGSLRLAANGTLVTERGQPVLGETQRPLTVDPAATVTITERGEVKADGMSVGYLRLVDFADPKQMTYEGRGLLSANAEAGRATPSNERVEVGKLEDSTASPVRAMSDLMMASRMFDAMERAMSTFQQIDRRLVATVPK
jgi:flagellar basal body rod protein FlgG